MNGSPPATSVVVGVDGSPDSVLAVRWAAADAVRRGRPLHLLHAAYDWRQFAYPQEFAGQALRLADDAGVRQASERIIADATAEARQIEPDLPITTATVVQPAVPALMEVARHAALVAVGSRGRTGFAALLVGSTGAQLAAHADCPVVIVRRYGHREGPHAGRVVVGVDGSHHAGHALGFAFEQAAFREAGLTAVHVYRWPAGGPPDDMLPLCYDPDDLRDDEQCLAAESLSGWRERYPEVEVRLDTVSGRAGGVLAELSAGAQLLVVGARGRGGFTGLRLGSVSHAAVHHASCPVAVVHEPRG
ncbi:universal stress protein [Dactylosporangium aurantiacum]|uniref:Universal stress protein n=1 Tax=Dactylosporangium aurantiacum TaxID=35754 RepID=A0A9Q9IKK3_9ACTN|nr:universal stress protein [Dactylosporangium aurantiacum]MDG6110123.1 universal stress protein [Dactylosporangium aurantiacum]UWZ57869.1 universal stress protein [Dactylosporangium aurantiacum]